MPRAALWVPAAVAVGLASDASAQAPPGQAPPEQVAAPADQTPAQTPADQTPAPADQTPADQIAATGQVAAPATAPVASRLPVLPALPAAVPEPPRPAVPDVDVAPLAPAQERRSGLLAVPVDVTATMTAGVHAGARDHGEVFGRLNASTSTGPWAIAARVDTATFTEAPAPGADDRYTLEKASVRWAGRSLEVTAGDAYVSFGRGLGLSLRKVDELGVDTTLRGAQVLLRRGEVDATFAAGYVNINNVDEATGTSADDPYDLVAGAQVQARAGARATVGGYAAGVAFRDSLGPVPNDPYTDRSAQLGVTLSAPRLTRRYGLYLEAMGQAVSTEPATDDAMGYGLYGSATGYFGPVTVLVEGKAYGALTPLSPDLRAAAFSTVAYSSPPTVERVQQILENPQRDIAGGRVRADWTLSPSLVAFASYGAFLDREGYADPEVLGVVPGTIHDPYAGIEARWNGARSWAIATGGWRAVTIDSGAVVRGDGHLDVNLSHAVTDRVSVTLHALHEERKKHESVILDEQFREGTIDAGVRVRPWVTVSAGYDYTTEPTQPKRDYFHGNVAWDITASSSVQLFVGSARGGLRCVNGVCRVLPPFEGVKLIATLRM